MREVEEALRVVVALRGAKPRMIDAVAGSGRVGQLRVGKVRVHPPAPLVWATVHDRSAHAWASAPTPACSSRNRSERWTNAVVLAGTWLYAPPIGVKFSSRRARGVRAAASASRRSPIAAAGSRSEKNSDLLAHTDASVTFSEPRLVKEALMPRYRSSSPSCTCGWVPVRARNSPRTAPVVCEHAAEHDQACRLIGVGHDRQVRAYIVWGIRCPPFARRH